MLRAWYRLVLHAFPRTFRQDFAREMEEVFVHCVEVERARRRGLARTLAPVRGFLDALVYAVAMRREQSGGQVSQLRSRERRRFVVKQDYRSTLRLARTQPRFVVAVVLMLGLGIGATTAIFSVVYGVLLKPLPFPEPDRIVQVWGALPARNLNNVSFTEANFWDMRDANRTFDEFGALHSASFSLKGFDAPERVTGGLASVGFFRALGVRPIAGRLFAPGEDAPGAPIERALLSYGFWTRHFGTDRTAVGRTLTLDGQSFQIIGILPAGTPWLDSADIFVPFIQRTAADRGSWEYTVIGRTKPGITIEAARGDLQRIARELEARHPDTNRGLGVTLASSVTWIASDSLRRMLWVLLGAVGLLLLIACVNVTNLLLARASGRARESAVRSALGASRFDLIRERLTESVAFSVAGTLVGLLLAAGLLKLFKSFDPGGIPRLADVEINRWVYTFAGGAALFVGVATGLVPALQTPLADIAPVLRAGQRGSVGDRSHHRVRNVLVAAEVAISLVLLVGAGLLVRSLTQVLAVDRGFQTDNRLLVTVSIPGSYGGPKIDQISADTLTRLRSLPGVLEVAAVSGRPLSRGSTGLGIVAADHPDVPEASVPWATWRIITPDYFKAMGLPLMAGRGFTDQDEMSQWRVIISKRLADQLWPGENPIGRTAILWKGQNGRPGQIIGVAGNMRERGLENDPTFAVYFPAGRSGATSLQLVLHAKAEPQTLMPAIRTVIASIDANLPVSNVRTLDDLVDASVATRRFTMLLLATFAGLALVLALAGVYGVLAYVIARKTSEIGVRLALGAQHGRVLRLIVLQGLRPVAVGIMAGLAATLWLSRLLSSLLFNVQPGDPVTYVIVCGALILTAASSCYLPARRVLRVDPVEALRTE